VRHEGFAENAGPALLAFGEISAESQKMSSTSDIAFITELADSVRSIAMRYFRAPLLVDDKPDESPVTVADREIEAFIRAKIRAAYPERGIIGEEEGWVNTNSRSVWVVDPIDGTKSFVTGNPLFGSLMALLEDGRPVLGQIDIPALDERWQGRQGFASTFNGNLCHTSGCTNVKLARAYTTDPMLFCGPDIEAYEVLRHSVKLLRFGGDCYNYGLLASGHCDLVMEVGLQPYDYLPLVPVIAGAGGVITDWSGRALTVNSRGDVLAAATPKLHAEMIARLTNLNLATSA
jgi:inositol-phosphate phosphatase/L-galactose 1-phosphate phosphatase/histidinol-phosphatase